ncbi:transglutaminase domain-containing protein [Streptosporangium lutulentum]
MLDLTAELRTARAVGERDLLIAAHRLVAARVRPVYGMDDRQPVSVTLALGRGSCSQRMAVLEAVARACGIATRVRGLLVDGRFWYPRFPRMGALIPHRVVLAWPEFRFDGRWVSVSGLYGDLTALRAGEDSPTTVERPSSTRSLAPRSTGTA